MKRLHVHLSESHIEYLDAVKLLTGAPRPAILRMALDERMKLYPVNQANVSRAKKGTR